MLIKEAEKTARVEFETIKEVALEKIRAAQGDRSWIEAIDADLKIELAKINTRKEARIAQISRG